MLKIRLHRSGKKNQPSFKIVVVDKRRSTSSEKFVEVLGFVNRILKERKINAERVKYWLGVGAKPSNTVYNLLVEEGILEGKKIPVHKKPKEKEKGK
ncbi:30S ribosomal protein S16 [Candidatus Parcubacteria bacterium]|nr:30S ribosomal protein S16 [Candidatus Parcubacteria bacterium]